MLCASMPLPSRDASTVPVDAEAWPLAILDEAGLPATNRRLTDEAIIGSARLQLAWPWLLTAAAADAPEGLEAPEGRLMGMIARSAVERGAFRSAAGRLVPGVTGIVPMLTEAAMRRGLPNGRADWIGDRLCVVGQKTDQFVLLSDSTMAASRSWRAGGVSRLMGLILRAARAMGQDRVFEPSGPALWNGVRQDLEGLMERLRTAGALAGDTPADAYTVRCDASTMMQSDIDLGRIIATVAFTAAQPIERIVVTLSMGTVDAQALKGAA
jgi:phage tail sheath protein FI